VTFHIECPSTGGNWTLQGTDPAPLAGQYGLFMGDEGGAHWQVFSVDGEGPPPASSLLSAMTVDDDQTGESSGNGNKAFEPAETIELAVTIHNTGTEPLENAYAVLQSLDYQVVVTDNYEEFGTIPVGGYATCLDDFGLSTGGSTPWDLYGLRLTVFADGGGMLQTDFGIPVGCGLACDVESGYADWMASSVTAGWGNNWHVSTARNHTTGGVRSFKCGDTGARGYDDHLYCSEASPWFNVPLNGELSFGMRTDAQTYSTDALLALDGGLIQLGQFGNWTTVVPGGGYSHEIVTGTTGPYRTPPEPPSIPASTAGSMSSLVCPPLLSGPQQLRFVFGSDNAGTREGWYIEDISVTGPTGVGDDPPSAVAVPNPFSDAVLISLAGSISGDDTMDVFDLTGRKIIELAAAQSQGGFAVLWNGRDGSGTIVPAGVYISRCSGSDGQIRTLRLDRTRQALPN
jgi:hypothetical protein